MMYLSGLRMPRGIMDLREAVQKYTRCIFHGIDIGKFMHPIVTQKFLDYFDFFFVLTVLK